MNQDLEVRSQYEDEIDLIELIKVLIKGKFIIGVVTLVFLVIGTFTALYLHKKSTVARTFIAFNYDGIESGQNPDGSRFDINLIKSTAVLEKVYGNYPVLEGKGITVEALRQSIEVEGIVPTLINTRLEEALKKGETFEYYPVSFKINFSLTKEERLDRQILTDIVSEYKKYFEYKYNSVETLGRFSSDLELYDYVELIDLMTQTIRNGKTFLEDKKGITFRSYSDGVTFSDLYISLDLLENIEFKNLKSIVENQNLTKNEERLIEKYKNSIRELNLKMAKAEAEQGIIKTMLDNYKPNSSKVILPSIDGSLSEGREESYYSKLIERATEAGVEAVYIAEDINYLENKVKEIKVQEEAKEIYIQEANKLSRIIEEKINTLTNQINNLMVEYNEVYFSNVVRRIGPVESISTVNIKMIIAMSIVLGIFCGVFVVFGLEFKKKIK